MLKRWTWLALLLAALLAFSACSSDDSNTVTPPVEDTAFDVLAAAGAAYINGGTCPGIISADALAGALDDFTVIDVRSESAYLAGHIPGAYLSSISTVIDDITTYPQDKPFVVTCYSGQLAGHVKIALELLGYDIQSLGFGMCSWNEATNSGWENGHGDNLIGEVETTNNNGDLTTTYDWPVLEDLGYEAGTVVVERVRDTLAAGFKSIKYINSTNPAAQLAGNEENYFIINYWGESDYDGTSGVAPGHIPGAYQFTPAASLGMDQMLNLVPTDMPIVVYCWTGQTSSQITFYLNMLGYDAYSLAYGANGLFYSDLTAHKWTEGGPAVNQTMEEAPTPLPAYETLFNGMDDYMNAGSWYINAQDLSDLVDDDAVTILDIRSTAAWEAGHIDGAVDIADYKTDLPQMVADDSIPTDKQIVVVCYTGQNAGWASAYLNLMGYDSKSLLFGMAGWTSTLTGPWDTNVGDALGVVETANNNDSLDWNMYPALDDYSLEARANAIIGEGFQGVSYADVASEIDNYFVVNYWGEADYNGTGAAGAPGHIPGAFQFTPGSSMTLDTMLANLPSQLDDDPIIVYCWTGQTSAQITMMLRMLGYDAYSLKFGANSLFHADLTAHVWNGNLVTRDLYDVNGDLVDQGATK